MPPAAPMSRREAAFGLPVAAVAGLLIGVLGAFKHQVGVSAATGSGFPVGLLLGLAMVVMFVLALRSAFPSRWYAVAAAAGVVLAVGVLDQKGPGGSVVVLQNAVGVWWTFGAASAAVGVALVPIPRRRAPASASADGILEPDPPAHDP